MVSEAFFLPIGCEFLSFLILGSRGVLLGRSTYETLEYDGWQLSDSKEVNFEPPKAILYIYIFRHQQFQVIVQWDRYVWSRNGVLDFLLGCRKCYHINRLHWSTGLDLKRVGVVVKIKPKPKSNEPNIACKIER